MLKRVLGLDLGTNSIGWALVQQNSEEKQGNIIAAGSRILPMSQDILGKFDSGQSISQTAERTRLRGIRRLRERQLLRRERLHRVLNILGFLPKHYADQIDFKNHFGKFIPEAEPKLAWILNDETTKADFLFKRSFQEMVEDFAKHQPQLTENKKKIPYDWTIYFLRKKALTNKIEKEELAWLLLNFNQKRGYYQLRGEEDDETPNQVVEFYSLKVIDVVDSGDRKGRDEIWYNVHLENGWIYRRTSRIFLDWVGKIKDFIVTTDLNDDGTVKKDKEGKEKRSFRAPAEDDWTLLKKKTEADVEKSYKTVGTFIYDTLLQNPAQKIKGKLVRVIERKFYKSELEAILKKQKDFHNELIDETLYRACLEELYENNDAHRNSICQKDFTHLFLNDIIFFQRPLKTKKSLISDCKFESRPMKDKDGKLIKDENGKQVLKPLRCISKSHPLFQEFRLLQFIQNIKLYQKEKKIDGKLETDVNVTGEFLKSAKDWINLLEWMNERKEIDQKAFLKYPRFSLKRNAEKYRWNYVEDKSYPCNETRALIISRLNKLKKIPENFLTKEIEEALWHILYSVEDKNDIVKALKTFADKHDLQEDFVEQFKKFPPFKKEYGSYSAKAIKKFLPLMRFEIYWSEESIHSQTKNRIEKILNGEYDETIRDRVRDKSINLTEINQFQGLPVWLVSYIVYDRHSEDGEVLNWETPADIEHYLKDVFKQHSLRNPIVEQVITETLRVVKDIWQYYGKGETNFFDEIHIELGREMKNPADRRKQMTNQITENENTNLRIKALLAELLNDSDCENVRPYSPMQQEILKIYEEGALNIANEIPEEIIKISKQAQPTQSELLRYKLWLQQKYRSPYTGEVIPLNKLFTRAYDIEHIIPQSRFFDDSFSNKIICEVEVNTDKDNSTAYEYIKNNRGKKIDLSHGKTVTLFTIEAYEDFVKGNYEKSRNKMKKLLMEEIPEAFIQRQMNDSRYISKIVKNLMSNIVREIGEQEAISKNVIASNGLITSALRQDWGLNDIWNEIITPRFERLNEITKSKSFGDWTNKDGKRIFQTQVPLELQKGFSKKRIDHRHHALDAIVIACATRNHINYLNNDNANGKDKTKPTRFDLRNKLRRLEDVQIERTENGQKVKKIIKVAKEFYKPWSSFTQNVKEILSNIVVSFKQNLRVINKTVNHYQVLKKDGQGKSVKVLLTQTKGDNWAIRKSMHKDTVSGLVQLKFQKTISLSAALDNWEMIVAKDFKAEIKRLVALKYDKEKLVKYFKEKDNKWGYTDVSRVEIHYWDVNEKGEPNNVASRVKIDDSFSSNNIKSITDTGIQKIMLNHLKKYDEDKNGKISEHPELAFSPDGVDKMNKTIQELNDGKSHKPINKVRTFELKGNKFNIGQNGNKAYKYTEAAKGTNLFFGIYLDENGKRSYATVPLNIVIERKKQGLSVIPENNESGHKLLFHLSPNELVYVPTEEERANPDSIDCTNLNQKQKERIYKFIDGSGTTANFIPSTIADLIFNPKKGEEKSRLSFPIQNELGLGSPQSKNQKSFDDVMIKNVCVKLKVDRLGNLSRAPQNSKYTSEKNDIVKEPDTVYETAGLKKFFSFDEMENDQLKYFASLEPIALLQNLKQMVLAVFGYKTEPSINTMPRIINFTEV